MIKDDGRHFASRKRCEEAFLRQRARIESVEAERDRLKVELESLKQNITSQYRNTGLR